jgi:peptidoglycan-associated lipoprotein
MNILRTVVLSSVLLPLTVAGCKKTSDDATATADPSSSNTKGEGDPSSVHVDQAIAEMCSLPRASFDFDSTALTPQDRAVLDALSTCFTTGPAKDHSMRLTGHADPRGADEYNLALGQRRADGVADYLHAKGVAEQRTETTSRGELDAEGQDDRGWAADRRVDIVLAD